MCVDAEDEGLWLCGSKVRKWEQGEEHIAVELQSII